MPNPARACHAAVLASITLLAGPLAAAADGGPDYWRVTGLEAGAELNMRRGPATEFSIVVKIPHDAEGLLNLGCYPNFSLGEWEKMSKKEQGFARGMRWCRIMYRGEIGWAFARFLAEG